MADSVLPHSPHFTLHELADGILAVISPLGGSASCNAGLMDLGGRIVVFDAFFTLQAARSLRSCAETAFGRSPHILINSHYHNDHIWGNQVFVPEALIMSCSRTRQLMATDGAEEVTWNTAHAGRRLDDARSAYAETANEQERSEAEIWVRYYESTLDTLPHLSITLPSVTFSNRLELHGARHTAALITYENAHTGSDTILHLRREGIIFMGDLLFVRCHPYLADGDPLQLLTSLREISQLGAAHFVPGHGPLGTSDDVRLMIAYIESGLETARALVRRGGELEKRIAELPVPSAFSDWRASKFYRSNISFLCAWLSSRATAR